MQDILSEWEDSSGTEVPEPTDIADAEGGGPGGGGGCLRGGDGVPIGMSPLPEAGAPGCRAAAEPWRGPKAENLPMLAIPRKP